MGTTGIQSNRALFQTQGIKFVPSGSPIVTGTSRPTLQRATVKVSCSANLDGRIGLQNTFLVKPEGIGVAQVGNTSF